MWAFLSILHWWTLPASNSGSPGLIRLNLTWRQRHPMDVTFLTTE